MNKKIKCKGCGAEFIPTLGVNAPACPQCQTPAPMATARAAFAAGEPVLLPAAGGDDFDIQWMPPGQQTPCCTVEGKPKELSFTVKPHHATAFNAQLQALRSAAAAGKGDLPFIDFDHEDGRASGRPVEMYWGGDDLKKGGIRLKGKWTASGKAGVTGEAPDYTRFSPEWYFDEDGEPLAIGPNLGGLVNRAAFKNIASVKAAAATNNTKPNMTKEEFQALLTDALKPINSEIAALKATAKGTETAPAAAGAAGETELTKAIAKALKPVTDKLDAIELGQTENRKAQAKAAVQTHVSRGAIAPADTASVEFWEKTWLADAAAAEVQLKKLPGKAQGRFIENPGQGTHTATSAVEMSEAERLMLEGASKLKEKNKAIASNAQALEAFLRTPEGNALYAQTLAGRSANRRDIVQAR